MSLTHLATAASSSARGTTSLISPSASASAALMRLPVSIMPMALRNGICRCNSVMPPSSGKRPTSASGRPKLASSQATTMSQPSTISNPPPKAKPFTRAITGMFSVSRSAMPPKPPVRGAAQYSRPVVDGFFMSAPTQKARSPEPVSTMTRMSRLFSRAVQMRCNSASVSRLTAFKASGRANVTVATWPSIFSSTLIWPPAGKAPRPAPHRYAGPGAAARGAAPRWRWTSGSGW